MVWKILRGQVLECKRVAVPVATPKVEKELVLEEEVVIDNDAGVMKVKTEEVKMTQVKAMKGEGMAVQMGKM